MTGLSMLWLPILLSAVFVFVASSIIHMLTPWHKSDYPKYKDEANVLDTLRPLNIPPGDYMMPIASSTKELASPEFMEKVKKGPVVVMTVLPNEPSPMGRNLALWFVYSLIVSVFAAYIAGRTAPPGKRMGHAGAIISGGKGTAAEKVAVLEECGISVAASPAEMAQALLKVYKP